jgi:molybdopterin-guanine dinucleotide biosynthesis protein A
MMADFPYLSSKVVELIILVICCNLFRYFLVQNWFIENGFVETSASHVPLIIHQFWHTQPANFDLLRIFRPNAWNRSTATLIYYIKNLQAIIISFMLSVVVQAGGESSRMGQDKALIPFLGQPLINRVLERLAPIGDEILVTTNKAEDYRFLRLPLYNDILPGRGALGGLFTALSVAGHPLVAVVACDMPFVHVGLLRLARDRLVNQELDAVIPETEGGMEPFHAVYRRETCLTAVKTALDSGKWRLISWLDDVKVATISPEEVRRYDPLQLAFFNVNSPEDLQRAERLAKDLEHLTD